MPNHITNILTIKAKPSLLATIRKEIKGVESGNDEFDGKTYTVKRIIDFNSIIPQDPSLGITSDGLVSYLDNRFYGRSSFSEFLETLKKYNEKSIDNFAIALKNFKKYGHGSWYTWCVANWGTKWNAYSIKQIKPSVIKFETAWSSPGPVFVALSKKYPDAKFEVQYADEDIGNNCGHVEYRNGEVFLIKEVAGDEAVKFACKLKGWDYKEFISERAQP